MVRFVESDINGGHLCPKVEPLTPLINIFKRNLCVKKKLPTPHTKNLTTAQLIVAHLHVSFTMESWPVEILINCSLYAQI